MITCLHTADVHVATFSALLPDAAHVVRTDFLDRARTHGVDTVAREVGDIVQGLAKTGAVLCTCSTLGPVVDALGLDNVVRIDRPALAMAAALGGEVVIAICLKSTKSATLSLFDEVAQGRARAKLVVCDTAWPLFEAGDMDGYAADIAATLQGEAGPIVLAQASMACAAPLIEARGVTVFTTPKAAAKAVLAVS